MYSEFSNRRTLPPISANGSAPQLMQNGSGGQKCPVANGGSNTIQKAKKKEVQRLTFLCDGKQYVDTLHAKCSEPIECNDQRCLGSLMEPPKSNPRPHGEPLSGDALIKEATDFIEQFFASINKSGSQQHLNRLQVVLESIRTTGTYDLSKPELSYAVKTAWRNAARCIGRIQWSRLQLFDARHLKTASEMFDAICDHVRFGTNKGNIRSVITVFPQRKDGTSDYRVWNTQIISYAGYRQDDGSIIGDPANVEFTRICEKMGWKGDGGMFDVLPLILQANGKDPEMFNIPKDIILEVPLKHPRFPWFEEMGYKWYALPAVSCLALDAGGLYFPAIPFNGWYMCTEIGRDLCDLQRYNITENVAKGMGINTSSNVTLWKDHAVCAVNEAILYSFNSQRVTITDHHSASASFMKHTENEYRLRGGIPGDWVWVVPPVSGSMCPVFHLEMLNYKLKPSYEYQPPAWKNYVWKEKKETTEGRKTIKKKITFKDLANAVRLTASMMGEALVNRIACTILYATETGRSESLANTLSHTFSSAFNPKVKSMAEFDASELEHESLVFFVTSTFGNGDPPENGVEFAKGLQQLKGILDNNKSVDLGDEEDTAHILGNVRFAVFGLGSSAYPNFCAFAEYLDNILSALGGERLHPLAKGDELAGQEESFLHWSTGVYKKACEVFMISDTVTNKIKPPPNHTWIPGKFRVSTIDSEKAETEDVCKGLSEFNQKTCYPCKLISVTNLQGNGSDRKTILVKIDTKGIEEMGYLPGDHVGILPENRRELVDKILAKLTDGATPDDFVQLEISKETTGIFGTKKEWISDRLPPCTLRQALTHYLDITTPPTPAFLSQLTRLAPSEEDMDKLDDLVKNAMAHDDWRLEGWPGLVEVLDMFPSLRLPPTFIMSQLPPLKQRFYSISSSPDVYPDQVHVTVAVVEFKTKGGDQTRYGVCSNWLNGLKEGDTIPIFIRSAKDFHLPQDKSMPILMVGPGTGIAPFRSFWLQRRFEKDGDINKEQLGEMHLYFGCRNSKADNIYSEERDAMYRKGVLTSNKTALSREPGHPKVYVQDLLNENSAEVFRLLTKEHGHLYVCGDVSMATDVKATVVSILKNQGDMSREEADNFMTALKQSNRYHEDIFGVTLKTTEVTTKARHLSKQKTLSGAAAN